MLDSLIRVPLNLWSNYRNTFKILRNKYGTSLFFFWSLKMFQNNILILMGGKFQGDGECGYDKNTLYACIRFSKN